MCHALLKLRVILACTSKSIPTGFRVVRFRHRAVFIKTGQLARLFGARTFGGCHLNRIVQVCSSMCACVHGCMGVCIGAWVGGCVAGERFMVVVGTVGPTGLF